MLRILFLSHRQQLSQELEQSHLILILESTRIPLLDKEIIHLVVPEL